MSTASVGIAVAVHMSRLQSGELCACIGIEGHAEVCAEPTELGQIEMHSDGHSTVPARLLFPLLGALEPMGVKPWQQVPVVHRGLDLGVVLGAVPTLCGKDSLGHEGPHE